VHIHHEVCNRSMLRANPKKREFSLPAQRTALLRTCAACSRSFAIYTGLRIHCASQSHMVNQRQLDMAPKRPKPRSWAQRARAIQQPAAAGRRISSGARSDSASSLSPAADADLPASGSQELRHQATQQRQEPQDAQPLPHAADRQLAPQQPQQGLQAQQQQAADQQEAPQQQVQQQPDQEKQSQRPAGIRLPAGLLHHIQQATQPQQLLPPDPEISGPAARLLAARLTWSQRQLAPILAGLPNEVGDALLRTLHDPRFRAEDLR
jgi:hypothetical protein